MNYEALMKEYPRFFRNSGAPLKIVKNKRLIAEWQKATERAGDQDAVPSDAARIGVVYEDDHIVIIRDLVQFPSGRLAGYSRLFNKGEFSGGRGVVVLPLVGGKIALLRHYRHATRSWHWEIPRGFGEPDVNPDDQARAEINEEIGATIHRLTQIGSVFINTGMEGNQTLVYIADISTIGDLAEDEGIFEYRLAAPSEMEQMIRGAEINDGFTLSAYALAKAGGHLTQA